MDNGNLVLTAAIVALMQRIEDLKENWLENVISSLDEIKNYTLRCFDHDRLYWELWTADGSHPVSALRIKLVADRIDNLTGKPWPELA